MTEKKTDCPFPVHRVVPYLHVADVEATAEFYSALGFEADTWFRNPKGEAQWVSVRNESSDGRVAEIFFARASGPIDASQQAVLLYLYALDVHALRNHLLAKGLHDGGKYSGQSGPNDGRRVVFEVQYPFYMNEGEIRVHDPDGYCLLIGQLEPR
ncbi:MAG: hypothetical protein H6819_12690 [Phycisphaerales bacterium]|nr:hypothetical protein [Phycisphaerales bacterium]MCB9856664.1 hypothetical protein [Phycisphaerales bacterium]MCB9862209.1 hypothetical protein [Phycisphaerales bacterium]